MRQAVQALATHASVAILSGRDLDDVRQRVNIGTIVYAGSHGFDIAGPRGLRKEMATEFLPRLDMVEQELGKQLAGIAGAHVERKRFSIAAHYRNVNEGDVPKVERAVNEVAARHRELRKMDGKKVYELLPDIDWNKGKAVQSGYWKPWAWSARRSARFTSAMIALTKMPFARLGSAASAFSWIEQLRPTAANYSLKDPAEVERFLRAFAGCDHLFFFFFFFFFFFKKIYISLTVMAT